MEENGHKINKYLVNNSTNKILSKGLKRENIFPKRIYNYKNYFVNLDNKTTFHRKKFH